MQQPQAEAAALGSRSEQNKRSGCKAVTELEEEGKVKETQDE